MRYREVMRTDRALRTISLAVPVAGVALLPERAEACSPDLCYDVDVWVDLKPLNAAAIPIDGVLVLQGAQSGGSPDAEWLAKIDLTVTRDGQPIAGALETSPIDDVLIWRPAAPLEPGAVYDVAGALHNGPVDPPYCGEEELPLAFQFFADAAPSATLTPPKTGASEQLLTSHGNSLTDLVCCDDAFPFEYGNCGFYDIDWDAGHCAWLNGTGTLQVSVTVDSGLPAPTRAITTRALVVDGNTLAPRLSDNLSRSAQQPFCTQVKLQNLATGETAISPQVCHGDALVEQLGPQLLDIGPELAEKCSAPAYVCEVAADGTEWDPSKCTPWPGDTGTTGDPTTGDPTTGEPTTGATDPSTTGQTTSDPQTTGTTGDPTSASGGGQDDLVDHGCSCDSDASSPAWSALALLALTFARPRRRRRRRR